MKRILLVLLLVLVAPLLLACGGEPRVLTDCSPADGVTPICGFENPEDLARLPGGSWIVVSQSSGSGGGSGSLVAFRVADGRKLTLFPDPDALSSESPTWGSSDCPGPPDPSRFNPHGVDVDLRSHRLAVVNHGREAIELFEMGHSPRGPAVVWRGCSPVPEDVWANDVALLPDGGFVVTRMMAASGLSRLVSILRLIGGFRTGHLLEWHRDDGWRDVPDSEGHAPNGVVVSSDGREIYFAEWTGRRLVRLRRDEDGGVERDQVELPHHPDNITWTRAGLLLVTGQIGSIGELLECGGTEDGTCALPFSVLLVEPSTLAQTLILEHPATAQGAGSVALEVGDEIFIGTLDGDRLARAAFEHGRAANSRRSRQARSLGPSSAELGRAAS